jgi:hypothetical protein
MGWTGLVGLVGLCLLHDQLAGWLAGWIAGWLTGLSVQNWLPD